MGGKAPGCIAEVPHAKAIAAASAARDLLGEVEMAFLASGASTPLGDFPHTIAATEWYSLCTPSTTPAHRDGVIHPDCDGEREGTRTSRWFWPIRHSWPPMRHIPGSHSGLCCTDGVPGSEMGDSFPFGPRGVPGDWVEELRRSDPCPLLRPPHGIAPETSSTCKTVTPQTATTREGDCNAGPS